MLSNTVSRVASVGARPTMPSVGRSKNTIQSRVLSNIPHLRDATHATRKTLLSTGFFCQAQAPSSQAPPIRRQDYKAPAFLMPSIDLIFDLTDTDAVIVTQKSTYVQNSKQIATKEPLVLDLNAEHSQIKSLQINGRDVPFVQTPVSLIIPEHSIPDDRFVLEAKTVLRPKSNTALAGLYGSDSILSTQCEAEGFRNITCVQDRPDVLSQFTTTIISKSGEFPVKLSNGNPQSTGVTKNGKDVAVWQDPFPKPSYLFALVAGDLSRRSDSFKTLSGKTVELNIFAKDDDIEKTAYAMEAVKNAMKWDEDTFGLEYDLDIFNVVAIDDFTMGAMENKGLNIFNSKLILASLDTATDADYKNIERVIGHEYFHNWSGNRVTCQDWFQLSLKEGLTVYRDQEFTSDMNCRGAKRIQDVATLRAAQFPEDAGPMAHPIRPEEVERFDNFYTATVYQKGAEVVRMMKTLLGDDGFAAGIALYFARHDGTAATCEDFVQAMEHANSADLSQFRRWYEQAGTPTVRVNEAYNSLEKSYELVFSQSLEPSTAKTPREPMMIPLRFSLMSEDGTPMGALSESSKHGSTMEYSDGLDQELRDPHEHQVVLTRPAERIQLDHIETRPILSLGREFSAPVKFERQQSVSDLSVQLEHDDDDFNRFEAAQTLMHLAVVDQLETEDHGNIGQHMITPRLVAGLRHALESDIDMALKAQLLEVPSLAQLCIRHKEVSIDKLALARNNVVLALASGLRQELRQICYSYLLEHSTGTELDHPAMALRSLKNAALGLLGSLRDPDDARVASLLLDASKNLTDRLGPLAMLAKQGKGKKELQALAKEAQNQQLLRFKYLGLVAAANAADTLQSVKQLWSTIDKNNPNTVYALLGGFMSGSYETFHKQDGSGYEFAVRCIQELDAINPQVATKMLRSFQVVSSLDEPRKLAMTKALSQLASHGGLSKNTSELVSKLVPSDDC